MQIVKKENYKDLKLNKIKKKILSFTSSIFHEMILFEDSMNKNTFFILENQKIIAVVPLYFEKNFDSQKIKIGSYLNLSIPGPIILENFNEKKFKKLVSLILNEIDSIAKAQNVKKLKINFSDTISYQVGSQKYFSLLEKLSANKFKSLFSIGLRIDLKKKYNEIFKNFSKGHKSEIKKQSLEEYYFFNYEEKKLEYKDFLSLLSHSKRNNNDNKMLYELFKKNKVYIVFSKKEEKEFFCCLFTLAGNTVEYFFSKSSLNHHSLIVSAINFFKKFDYLKFMNLGVLTTLDNFEPQTQKKKNIALFKKGFGGEKFKYIFFEKEY